MRNASHRSHRLHRRRHVVVAALLAVALCAPALAQSSSDGRTAQTPAATDGDPDRPVIVGSLPNPPATGPVQVLRHTVEDGRLVLVDHRGVRHLVPEGSYPGLRRDGTIVIEGKKISIHGGGDMALEGKKIHDNASASPAGGSTNETRGQDTSGSIFAGLPDDTYRSTAGASLTLRDGKVVRLQGF
jgi:hypothetical protein